MSTRRLPIENDVRVVLSLLHSFDDFNTRAALLEVADALDRAVRGCVRCGTLGNALRWREDAPLLLCDGCYERCREWFWDGFRAAYPTREVTRPSDREGDVYFARLPSGLIKIGVSTQVKCRMTSLEAELLATVPGGLRREKKMHRRFEELRVRPDREWFEPATRLLNYIESLA